MSGYLMRLVLRTRAAGATQPLQPFVRSASPIAELDQRIGIPGFEKLNASHSSPVETASAAGFEYGEVLQPLAPPGITSTGEAGGATVQRKVANTAATLGRPPNFTAPDLKAVVPPSTNRRGVLSSTIARHVTNPEEQAAPSSSGVSSLLPPKNAAADLEWPEISTGDTGVKPPGASGTRDHGTEKYLEKGNTRVRSTSKVGSLRPKPPILVEPTGSSPEDADTPASPTDEGTRVAIGRINVEVVSPPAAPSSTTVMRPEALTADSASVIGPLGSSIRPNLRLSLRYR